MRKGSGKVSAAVVVAAAIGLGGASGAGAQTHPAPVPCTSIGSHRYQCSFWPAGDGIHGGAPVQAASGRRVGFLNSGSNWVVCQSTGGTVKQGAMANNWWAWTEANDHGWGWVNALYGHGGDNYGHFRGVPGCPASQGRPPGGGTTPAPTPPPPPPPAPAPAGPTLKQRAHAIMDKTYSAFIAYKRSVHPRPFDWHSDGCSIPGKGVPGWVGKLVKSVSN